VKETPRKTFILTFILTLGLIFSVGSARGDLTLFDSNTIYIPSFENAVTTITSESSWQDFNYTTGEDIDLDLTWTVEQGSAQCVEFSARNKAFAPRGVGGMIDEFNCDDPTSTDPGRAQATVRFDTLKSTGLKAGPNSDPKALWIAGVAAMQRGERDVTVAYLQRLQKHLSPNSEAARVVQNYLAQSAPVFFGGRKRAKFVIALALMCIHGLWALA
jgi:hypothetical protein